MPRYAWRAVDIVGTTHRGILYARSYEHLDQRLFERRLALLGAKRCRMILSLLRPIEGVDEMMRQLAVLVSAGILLPDALRIIADQLTNHRLQDVVHAVGDQVQEGVALSCALEQYPMLFPPIAISLIRAGEESGTLTQALSALSDYLDADKSFKRAVRSSLALPMVTLSLFLVIASVIFVFVIPQFAHLFAAVGKDMPPLTRTLLTLSDCMRSTTFTAGAIIVLLATLFLVRMSRIAYVGHVIMRCAMKLPIVGSLIIKRQLYQCFEALALLTGRGMPLVSALSLVTDTAHNPVFHKHLARITDLVMHGYALSEAMLYVSPHYFSQDAVAMIMVGEESGKLAQTLKQLAYVYRMRTDRQLAQITLWVQPVLMLVLALFVIMLVVAVYGPLCNFADIV